MRKKFITFTYEGMNIHNPFVSPCSRFAVDPTTYGFRVFGKEPRRMWRLTCEDKFICIDERKDGNHFITAYPIPNPDGGHISHTLNEAIEAANAGESL